MGTGELNAGGNPVMDWHPIQGGVEVLLVASRYGNQDKFRRYSLIWTIGVCATGSDCLFLDHEVLDL